MKQLILTYACSTSFYKPYADLDISKITWDNTNALETSITSKSLFDMLDQEYRPGPLSILPLKKKDVGLYVLLCDKKEIQILKVVFGNI